MSRLKMLLRDASPSTRNPQHPPVQACNAVAQQTHTTQQALLRIAPPSTCNPQHPAPLPVDRRELTALVATFHRGAGDTEIVIGECVRDALVRPEAALRCYRALWERRGARGD